MADKIFENNQVSIMGRLYPISGSVTKCTERDFIWWMWQ